MGCNFFVIQDFIRLDFQVFREMGKSSKPENQGKITFDFNLVSKLSEILKKIGNCRIQFSFFKLVMVHGDLIYFVD